MSVIAVSFNLPLIRLNRSIYEVDYLLNLCKAAVKQSCRVLQKAKKLKFQMHQFSATATGVY